MERGKHRRQPHRVAIALSVVAALLVLGVGGTAFAAYRYDRARSDRIVPGVTIDGVAVGDMTRSQAISVVQADLESTLDRGITVSAGHQTWTRTLRQLGLSADVDAAVDAAMRVGDSQSWLSRAYSRLTHHAATRTFDLQFTVDRAPVDAFVASISKHAVVAPRDASFTLTGGKVVKTHAKAGHGISRTRTSDAIAAAVTGRAGTVEVVTTTTKPKVTDKKLGKTIVVDVSKNQLTLYDGFKVEKRYSVATAMQGFLTPDGAWEVVDKVENPTWHNPAPDGWGKDEPLVIPPGPGNPLGTRALYLNAPGIRIHGTPDDYSIGHYASHGCIRMHISQSEALYPLVPVGTPVFIVGAPPWGTTANPGAAG